MTHPFLPVLLVTLMVALTGAPAAMPQAAQPKLSINDVTLVEGNSGTINATFFVSLSRSSSQSLTVQFATQNGSAFAAPPFPELSDYAATSGTLTIHPGDTLGAITVPVRGDIIHEPNETFFVNLSNPAGASLDDGQGLATLVNDDPLPEVSIDNVVVAEGGTARFTVRLSNPSSQSVLIDFATADGTAQAVICTPACAGDYSALSATIGFLNRQTVQTISIPTREDSSHEPNEHFFVTLTAATNATIADGQAVGTIFNDDLLVN